MDWLPDDCPSVRVFGVHYETALSEWSTNTSRNCPCEKSGTIHNRSEELLNSLVASGIGDGGRPIIWIGHSMGGLVAKSVIVQAAESPDPRRRQLAENTRGILFMGTPHKGSAVAKLKQHVELLFSPTIEVKELIENGTVLLNLHEKFLQFMQDQLRTRIISVAEGCPTVLTSFKFPFFIVNAESARASMGDFYVLNMDHLGLSKPFCRQSFLYQLLLAMLRDVKRAQDEAAAVALEKCQYTNPLSARFPDTLDDLL